MKDSVPFISLNNYDNIFAPFCSNISDLRLFGKTCQKQRNFEAAEVSDLVGLNTVSITTDEPKSGTVYRFPFDKNVYK